MRDEALKLALDALINHEGNYKIEKAGAARSHKAITAIQQALAAPAQVQAVDRLMDEAKVLADMRPSSTSDGLYQWALDAEETIRRLLKAFNTTPPSQPAPVQEQVKLRQLHEENAALRKCALKYLDYLQVTDQLKALESDLKNPEMLK